MKKAIFSLLILMTLSVSAQESYWSNYSVVVEPQNVDMFYKLCDDYFTANKTEGVTVTLFENHFHDAASNFTHVIGFSGSLEALGNMYAKDGGAAWKLFLVQLNQHIKEGSGAYTGTILAHWGDLNEDLPIQKLWIVHADDGATWDKAYTKYATAASLQGVLVLMGNVTAGVSPDGENRWVINGFKDFKSALGGADAMRSDAQKAANAKAWKEFMDTDGESHLIRSSLRIRIGKW
ncbi:MAG: hypothetical protein MUO53_13330 [Maribacter sp.]|nr:hypothetical protein [Maribacter sp.]